MKKDPLLYFFKNYRKIEIDRLDYSATLYLKNSCMTDGVSWFFT